MTPRVSLETRRDGPRRRIGIASLLTLGGFAVAQPLFSLLRSYPEFLVAHRASPADIVLVALCLSFVLPLVVALPAVLLHTLSVRLAHVVEASAVALLAGVWWAQAVNAAVELPVAPALATSLVLGAATGAAYFRSRGLRRMLAALSVVAAALPVAFLVRQPVADLLGSEPDSRHPALTGIADTPVVVLVFDELSLISLLDANEGLDRSRFPHLTALADDGVWYRNATTVAESTSYAVPAILSGRYPFAERLLPTAGHYPTNLFSLLSATHALHVVETVTALCPEELCSRQPDLSSRETVELWADLAALLLHRVAPAGLRDDLPEIGDRWTGFWEPDDASIESLDRSQRRRDRRRARRARMAQRKRPRETFERFLSEVEAYPPATVHYLHVLLPHAPWRYVPSGHSYPALPNTGAERDPETGDFSWVGGDWEIAQGLQRHLLQVGFVDLLLGRLVERLKSLDLYDQAVVVVTADHGVAFRRGHSTRHPGPGGETLVEIANVPLVVKYPGNQPRGVDDGNVETIDILPTVVAALGGDASALTIDGSSLLGGRRRTGKRVYPSWRPGSDRGIPRDFSMDRLRGRPELVRSQREPFTGEGWAGVYAMGPLGALVGRHRDAIEPAEPLEIDLDGADRFADVDPDARLQPLLVSGRVISRIDPERWLALLIDDRVAAVTRAVESDKELVFRAMIRPDSLDAGSHRVELAALQP